MLKPQDKANDYAYIIEFKVHKPRKEKNLEETLANALIQIDEKRYEARLIAEGFAPERIRKYPNKLLYFSCILPFFSSFPGA